MRSFAYIVAACLAVTAVAAVEKKIVCYFGSWSVYRPNAGKFSIDDIDASLCTHFVYTFVGLDGDEVKVLDPWQDLPDDYGKDGFRHFNSLRKKNSSVKTLIAIGGWTEGSEKYSKMAANETSRKNFVESTVAFVKKHGFDGFDVDWEYPAQRGGKSYDVKNYVLLLKELRKEFDKEGLLLTAALAAAKFSAAQSYNIPEISKYLDFMNLMAYDFHGAWEHVTGINAPLYYGSSDTRNDQDMTVFFWGFGDSFSITPSVYEFHMAENVNFCKEALSEVIGKIDENVDNKNCNCFVDRNFKCLFCFSKRAAVEYWLSQGAPAEKLILGIATYGRSFTLANSNAHEVGDPVTGPGKPGPYTREKGSLGYNEICEMQKADHWARRFDKERRVPYTYRGDQWVGYDNVKSVKEKAAYINKMGLGGGMIWSLETDDFRGICGEKYLLIRSLRHVLRNGNN